MPYIDRARPPFIIRENMLHFDSAQPGGDSDIATASHMKAFLLDPWQFCEAQNRRRLWMVGAQSLTMPGFRVMETMLGRLNLPQAHTNSMSLASAHALQHKTSKCWG